MTLADLQSNISISAQNAVTGDIEFCTGYTGFSDDIGEQAGWYLALKVSTSAEGSALEGATITATYAGTVRTLEDGETFIIRLAEGENSITFTANKEGYSEGRLTLDLSGLTKEALTQNIMYTASLTNGVTVSPLQFGESKTITGQVPWNTTDNANTFNISMRPFEMVAPGTPWSIAFNGVKLAEGEFSTITPASGSPYSFTGAKLAVTQEMISAQSPNLVVTVRPDSGDPLDAFYSSMNIGGLTLEAGPNIRIISVKDSATLSPDTYSDSYIATGTIPEIDPTNHYGQFTLQCEVLTVPSYNYFYYRLYDDQDNNIESSTRINAANMGSPRQINAINVRASMLGTNKTMTVKLFGGETISAVNTLIETVTIDVSSLTIQPFENNVIATDTGVSITPSTYNTSKTVTGEVPYDTTASANLLNISCSYNCHPSRSYYVIQVVNSSNTIIYDSGNIATGLLPNPNSFSIPITNNEIGTGEYITMNMYTRTNKSGTLYPVGQSIVLDTSALTLEAAPTPSHPDFAGVQSGDLGYTFFEMSPDYSTYYEFDPSGWFQTAALTYVNSGTQDGHTKYQYEATPDFNNECYVKYLDPSKTWFSCRKVMSGNDLWLFTRSSTINMSTQTSGVYEYGNELSTVMSANGFPCNAFYCIQNADPAELGDYHYTMNGSATPPSPVDMSTAGILIFATKGDSTSIPSTPIEFKLYNSTGSDYILISINMSNVTASQYQ